jgi:hypothetical protein
MPHSEALLSISITVIEISDLNSISPVHRVIMFIYSVLPGNRFAALSWMLTTADSLLFPEVEDSPKLTKKTKTDQRKNYQQFAQTDHRHGYAP